MRALNRVRSYLRQFSEEEQQQQKAEEEQRKKKEENAKSSSLATVAVASSQPSTSALPPATASVAGVVVAQSQLTMVSGLKLSGLTLPTVGDGRGLLSSSSASGMNGGLDAPPLGASSQPGSTSLTLGGTATLTSASVSVPTGLNGTVGVGLSQPKVSSTAGGMSSLLLNPLQSSSLLGNVSSSSSQPLSGIKLGSSVLSTAAPLASSLQLGASNTTTVTAFTLPTVTAQSSNGLNLQFNSAAITGRQSVPSATDASGGPAPLSFATALGQPLKGASNSALGSSGIQVPQVGTSARLGQGSMFPPSTTIASFSTLTASFPSASTGGLFNQPEHTVVSSSTATNPTASLFGASSSLGLHGLQQSNGQTGTAQPQPSLFGTPAQGGVPSQSVGLSLFGRNQQISSSAQSSMQSQGGSIFGAVQSGKGSLFGSINQGNSSQGLFAGSSVAQAGSVLGTTQALGVGGQGVQQSVPLLGGSRAQQSTSSLFGTQSTLSAAIFGNTNPSNVQSGPLPFNGKSLSSAAMGTLPTFNFAAQNASATSTLSQLGNRTGNSTSFQQLTQPLTFSATPQFNFSAASGFNTPPVGGNTTLPTPASGRRPIAKAGRRIKRN